MKKLYPLLFISVLIYWGCSLPKSERIIRLEQDGLHTEWYDNGQKKEETTYKNGKKNGVHTQWYENGQKEIESTYKNGKLELETVWYENGQKEIEWTYKYGKDFSRKCWDEDGNECDSHHIPHIIIHHTLSH